MIGSVQEGAEICFLIIIKVNYVPVRTFNMLCQVRNGGPDGSSGKALGYGLDGPSSIPRVGGVEIFLHSYVSRLALGSTQLPKQ